MYKHVCCFQAQSSHLCNTILDVINSIYHQDNANYFILVPQNTLSQFAEKIHTKSSDVQVHCHRQWGLLTFLLIFQMLTIFRSHSTKASGRKALPWLQNQSSLCIPAVWPGCTQLAADLYIFILISLKFVVYWSVFREEQVHYNSLCVLGLSSVCNISKF